MRIAWLTDLHLNFLKQEQIVSFLEGFKEPNPDAILIGGDTATARTIERHLALFEKHLQRPIYFVLGNHDFYGSSIASVHALSEEINRGSEFLHWLPDCGVVPLTEDTALIGHGCWADGRLGNGVNSKVMLNDYFYIEEYYGLNPKERFALMSALGDQAADYIKGVLLSGVQRFTSLYLLTHVPPIHKVSWHKGSAAHDDYLPHFTCKAAGDVLVEVMTQHPGCSLTVLSGHTHTSREIQVLPNLRVITGGAEYGAPQIQDIIHL